MENEGITAEAEMTETMKYILERSQNISRYSDKLSESITRIQKYFKKIAPISGVKFFSPESFYQDKNNEYSKHYYLCVLSSNGNWKLWVATYEDPEDTYWTSLKEPDAHSRIVKKEIIKALPKFMADYADMLQKVDKRYEEISEKAERMAEILEEKK